MSTESEHIALANRDQATLPFACFDDYLSANDIRSKLLDNYLYQYELIAYGDFGRPSSSRAISRSRSPTPKRTPLTSS
jgi:hypothetical protein